jgi:hypothetical protein
MEYGFLNSETDNNSTSEFNQQKQHTSSCCNTSRNEGNDFLQLDNTGGQENIIDLLKRKANFYTNILPAFLNPVKDYQ